MIRSFAGDETEKFFREGKCPKQWETFEKVAARKLDMIEAVVKLRGSEITAGQSS